MKRSVKFVTGLCVSLALAPAAWAQTAQPLPGIPHSSSAPAPAATTPPPSIQTAPAAPAPSIAPPVASISTGQADVRFKDAMELVKQNQLPEAEAALVDLTRDFPQFSGPQTQLGLIYARSKRPQLALPAFQRAVQANPQNAVAYNGMGMVLRETRDYARAEQAYLRALAINPSYAAASLNLGILYDAYLNRPQSALPYYKRYQQLGGQDDLRVAVWIAQIDKATPSP